MKKDKKFYQIKLKNRIEIYCKDLKTKLSRIPRGILKKISHIDIPDEEVVFIKDNSYSLKVKSKESIEMYNNLREKTKFSYYRNYFTIYKDKLKELKDPRSAYNSAEMELIKEFESQRENLYELLLIINALVRYFKKIK